MRLYASMYPEEVEGLVLIDPMATDACTDDFPWEECPTEVKVFGVLCRFGVAEVCLPIMYPSVVDEPNLNKLRFALKSRNQYFDTVRQEVEGLANWRAVRDEMRHLGDTPVMVLTTPGGEVMGEWFVKSREALYSISDDLERIEVQCGHYVNAERPDAVVDAVRSVVRRVKPK